MNVRTNEPRAVAAGIGERIAAASFAS